MRRVLLIFSALVAVLLIALAWYVYDRGITRHWRNYLSSQFRKQGIEISMRQVTFDPFRGLVANGVRLYDTRNRNRVIAVISHARVGVNYANALRGENFLDFVDLRNARLQIPLDPLKPKGPALQISKLSARLFFPPKQIYLSRAEAEISGMKLYATGRVINPQEFHASAESHSHAADDLLARIGTEWKSVRADGAPPTIHIEFRGDLTHPEEFFARIKLHGEALRRKAYRLKELAATVVIHGSNVTLEQFDAVDFRGEMHARGRLGLGTQECELRLSSTLDFQELNHAFRLTRLFSSYFFYDPPKLDLSLTGSWSTTGEPLLGVMHVSLGRFAAGSEVFDSLEADGSRRGENWSVRNLRVVHRSGELSADAIQLPGDFQAVIHSHLDPRAFLPLFGSRSAGWLARFDFQEPPTVDLRLQGKSLIPAIYKASGTATFGRSTFDQQPVSGTANLFGVNSRLIIEPFPTAEGGALTVNLQSSQLRLTPPAGVLPSPVTPAAR